MSTKETQTLRIIIFVSVQQSHLQYFKMVEVTIETVSVAIVGLGALNLALKAVLHVYKTFLRPAKNLKKLGKWAVVTGATGEL